jgi:signal transduction histidine kinase
MSSDGSQALYLYCEECNEGREVFTTAEAEAWCQGHLRAMGHDRVRVFQPAIREGEDSSRGKFFFLASMSHELRSLLNTIIGFSELLQETARQALSERQQRHLGLISESGRHILRHVSDMLDLSRLEAGAMAHEPIELNVAEALEDVLLVARSLAVKKKQTVHADLATDLPAIHADPVHFKQILFNLLMNAVKFTPDGGSITLRARPAAGKRAAVEIAVEDTGIGIGKPDLSRLFQEFSQLGATRSERAEGAGLGLALTRRLVELHGGTIWADSPGKGQGATFTVELPVLSPSPKLVTPSTAE